MSETSATYGEAPEALATLRNALEAAISKDAEEAERWWGAEAWDWVMKNQQRQAFNNQVDHLVERARNAVSDSEAALKAAFEPHENVPSKLTADASDWRRRARRAGDLAGSLRAMSPIEGWTGRAADRYGQAVEVQVAAVSELEGVMWSAANGAERGAILNRALFAIARNAIREAHERADMDLPGGDGYFYRRTARWGDYLEQLPGVLREIAGLDNVQDAMEVLRSQLGDSIAMAQLLESGSWPAGVDAAGTEPADTGSAVSGNPRDDTDFDVPDSHTPGVCTGGAYRD